MPPAPVQLLHPVSRFRTMQTLQHSCRFEILKHVRRDHISELPVPQRVKDEDVAAEAEVEIRKAG